MRSRLLWKLLGINGLVVGLVISTIWITIDYSASDYFVKLGRKYDIAPVDLHRMFLDSAHRGLLWAGLIAFGLAGALSYVLTRRTLRPLFQMTAISREYAAGCYDHRIANPTDDEVGHLARAFNSMADGLRRTEELRKRLVSDLAHELRSPLTNVRGYLEGLADGVVPAEATVFASLQEEAMRLAHLIESLLQLSRADAAHATLRPTRIDIDELAGQVLDLFRLRFAARGVALDSQLGASEGTAYCDPEKVAQVLVNLLENAWRYTPPGGRVRVVAGRATDGVRVTVVNSGEAIAPADLPRIFERFFRGERSRSREFGGAGIGLAIVKELVEAHGGRVEAVSAANETRIGFVLPDPPGRSLPNRY